MKRTNPTQEDEQLVEIEPYLLESRKTIVRKKQKIVRTFYEEDTIQEEQITNVEPRRKIPLASENFKSIIEHGMLYVDKTDIIQKLLEESHSIFIARPRKFGKSLVIDIIFNILQGNKELFKGLKIYEQRTKWTRYAVVRLNFAFLPDISLALLNAVKVVAKEFNIAIDAPPPVCEPTFIEVLDYFQRVRSALLNCGIKVAVIVDEYDLPIVQYLENQNKDYQKCITENSEHLNQLFNHIKNDITGSVAYFIVTGVAKFAKTSMFSAANQLQDVSMSNTIATLYGYTLSDLETYFSPHLIELSRKKNISVKHLVAGIIKHFNGYCFSFESSVTVFNPYEINKLLAEQSTTFESCWINEGLPRCFGLKPWASKIDISYWQNNPISIAELNQFEPSLKSMEEFLPASFFTQVGLLTFRHQNQMIVLDFPNDEIRLSFCQALISAYVTKHVLLQRAKQCAVHIANNDLPKFKEQIESFVAYIPFSSIHNIAKYESYYHTCIYLLMYLMDFEVTCQGWTNTGIIDLVVIQDTFIWIIELVVDKHAGTELDKIEKQRYYEKYKNSNKQIEYMEIIISKMEHKDHETVARSLKRAQGMLNIGNFSLDKSKPKSWTKEQVRMVLLDRDVGVGLDEDEIQDSSPLSGHNIENIVCALELFEGDISSKIEHAVRTFSIEGWHDDKESVVRWVYKTLLV